MMLKTTKVAALAAACCLTACGQQTVSREETFEAAKSQIVAKATLDDGSTIEFLKVENGDVMIQSLSQNIEAHPLLQRYAQKELSVTELFEQATGESAPQALTAAASAMPDELAASPIEDGASHGLPEGSLGVSQAPLTAAQFTTTWCAGNYSFKYCWPNQVGNPWVQRTSKWLDGVVNAINGNVRIRYRMYYSSAWHTAQDVYVLQGWVLHYYYHGSDIPRRFEVLGNNGKLHHFSVRGID